MAYEISKVKLEPNGEDYELKDYYLREILKEFNYDTHISKNSIARGKDITSYYTDGSLYTRISEGTFEDLFIGDYITASYNGTSTNFRIAGFNTFWGVGKSTPLKKTHIVMVPDTYLNNKMNNSNTTGGGYIGSYMYKTVIGSPVTSGNTSTVNGNLYNIFGNHLLTYEEYLSNSVNGNTTSSGFRSTNGATNGNAWVNVQAVLMSEIEVFGTQAFSSSGYDAGNGVSWLPLFRLMPQLKQSVPPPNTRAFWLRNVSTSTYFSLCYSDGDASYNSAKDMNGVRPRFLIG